ncbi:MAG: filamentous hemagglutinin N-terminal domain-containing protein [Rhodocyclaceae bacterium]|nr:filamentous hemagglutinin N-terminal domain-containing protein [Rhodocyclaceae bacterium]
MFKHASVNKVFRLVWSEARQAWIAVAESARGRGKRSSTQTRLREVSGDEVTRSSVSPAPTGDLNFSLQRVALGSLVAALTMTVSGLSLAQVPASNALPTGAVVAAGQATINASGARMDVTQSTQSAIVNWSSFNIGSAAQVNIAQPNAASVILNRVEGSDPSLIFGRLTSNGHVFLTNPGGILFAPGAQVDVGGLVASSLAISNADFLAGKFNFNNAGAAGAVVNAAAITAQSGGFVALIAPQVSNTGSIVAPSGSIGMAAGDSVKLDFDHDGLLSFEVNLAAAAARADNRGQLIADGGRVVMNAQAKDALLSTVLNNDGLVRARSLESRGGEIWLGGGSSGVVSVTGTLDASGTAAGQSGGTVKVLGDKVGLFGAASIDASGVGAGGTVLVGGNWQGKGAEQNASATYVGKDVSISADAIDHGNGGKVVVWADDSTRFYGNISARGGALGGDGGVVEVSGKHALDFQGLADLRAPMGKVGNLLLDPDEITITHDTAANTTGISCADDVSSSCATPDGTATFLDTTATTGTLTDGTLNAQLAIGNTTVQTSTGDITSDPAVVITGGTSSLTLTSGAAINLGGTFTGAALNLNFVSTLSLAANPVLTGVTTVTATGDGTSTIVGPNANTSWTLSGTPSLSFGSGTIGFSGVATLQGGSAVDTFTLGAASTANIKGGDGIDVLALATNTLTGSFAGEAAGGSITGIDSAVLTAAGAATGFDGTSANVSAGFTDVGSLTGTGTLTGINAASAWAMNGTGGTYTSTNALTYSGFATLQGGSAVDTYTLGAASTANIKGGDGIDVLALATNTLTGSFAGEAAGGSITGIGSAVLTAVGAETGFDGTSANVSAGFADVGSLTGTGTLTGINTASAWAMNGTGGTYTSTNALTYSGFATLQGGSAVDTIYAGRGLDSEHQGR